MLPLSSSALKLNCVTFTSTVYLSLELKHAMFVYTEFLDHNNLKINSELP